MKNLGDMMKQVQAMQSRMAEMQAKLEQATVTGQSGGGLVRVTLSGKGAMTALSAAALLGLRGRDRQHAGLAVHIQHAGGVFGALDIAGHPQQVIGGA